LVCRLSLPSKQNIKSMNGSDNSLKLKKDLEDLLGGDTRDIYDLYFVPVDDAGHVKNSPYPLKDILYMCVNTINAIKQRIIC
jgi:hypothetical protein